MDYKNMKPHKVVIAQVIEDLAEAEGRMLSAREKMSGSLLADEPGYESIAAHISAALASAGAALAEAHDKPHKA